MTAASEAAGPVTSASSLPSFSPETPLDWNPNPNQPVSQPGVGQSGTLGDNSFEQPSEQMGAPHSMGAQPLPASPTQTWRESVGNIPGKWATAFQNAPTNIADYIANNPAKVGAMAVGAGAGLANAFSQPQQNEPGMPPRPSAPRPGPEPSLPNSPPSSPIVRPTPGVKGRGGFAVM